MKCERAWKSPHVRKARRGGRPFLSPRRVPPFSRGVIFTFACLSLEGKWDTILQQQIAATYRRDKSLRVNWIFWWKSLSPQRNLIAATCRKKSNQTEFLRLTAAAKFRCRDKDFHKNSPVHTKRYVAATCAATSRPTLSDLSPIDFVTSASLTHKNPQRRKKIHSMRSVGRKDRSIWTCVFVEIPRSWNIRGSFLNDAYFF